jgi:hypothetical protein
MPVTLTIHHETASSQKNPTPTLDCLTEFEGNADTELSFVKLLPLGG